MAIKKEKGKIKKEKKSLSILLIPHSPTGIKTLRFSGIHLGLFFASFAAIVVVITLSVMISLGFSAKNIVLEKNNATLTELNQQQQYLLQIEETKNKNIKAFEDKFKEITEAYITSNAGATKTSRSGDRDDSSFSKDMTELKLLLTSLDSTINQNTDIENKALSETITSSEVKLKNYLNSIPTQWPAYGNISSRFGTRTDPILFVKKYHSGLDIASSYGSSIRSSASGTVTFVGRDSTYGNMITISHGNGLSTMYGHLSKTLVKKGQTVKKGDSIANMGSSGRSTGSHLHFEIRLNSSPVDPLKYLESK